MNELFSAFGIDWRLLVVNIVNFGILLFALWYFLYAPIVRVLEERRAKVSQSVIDAELARERLSEIEVSRSDVLARAGHEADDLLARARKAGSDKERELVVQAEAAAARIVSAGEAEAREQKARAIAESKQEVAKLIVLGVEKAVRAK